ncbi:MAG: hypothetical protein HQK64_06075 [Desulfamplus sp.]|nr:hypothetical protein [Desulfamplus sp.]MBF0242034.1 hypothetical protein [Desulfamplus sp.]MBF0389236.1 hypothetical protein [Desulfamplus sp.]
MKSISVISILKNLAVILCCLVVIASCADKSQTVKIVPDIPVIESNQGKGKIITVKVIDKRPNNVIGYRSSSTVSNGGEITLSQSLEKLVLYESIKGLMKKGFNPLAAKSDDLPTLTIDIQEFRYYTSTSQWTGAVHTKATLRAYVNINNSSSLTKRFYENLYTVNNEKKNVVVTTAAQNEKLINEMLNDVMKKLLDDNQLIEFMGKWAE